MKTLNASCVGAIALGLFASSAGAALTQQGDYALGEAGSVGTAGTNFTALVDSVGTANNITNFQDAGANVTSIVAPGAGGADGSTAALNLVQNSIRNSGWFSTSPGYGLTDDWVLDLYFKTPDTTTTSQSYLLLGTNGNTVNGNIAIELSGNKVNLIAGNNTATRVSGFDYATNDWMRISVIDYNNTVYLFNGGEFVTSAAMTGSTLNDLRIGFGQGAASSRGAAGTWDEMKVYSFDHTTESIVDVVLQTGLQKVVTVGEYHLGESGSLAGGSPGYDFVDTATLDGAQTVTGFQNAGTNTPMIVSPGPGGAPGSTDAFQLLNGANSGYFGGPAFNFDDDFAFQVWANAASGQLTGTHDLMSMTNDSATARLSLVDGEWSARIGATTFASTAASADTWAELTFIRYDGVSYFLVDGQFIAGSSLTTPETDANGGPMFFFGPGGTNPFKGILDEGRVYRFDSSLVSLAEVAGAITIPTPAALPAGLGLLGLAAARRRRATQ